MDLSAIGRQFGLSDEQTRVALEALGPVVAAGVRRSAQTPEGLQDMMKSILVGGHDQALSDPEALALERAKPRGDDILGQIFGSKDVSRGVAQQLSATSGIGATILKNLLPIVASMVLGKLAKGFGGGAAPTAPAPGGGGLGDILKDILGGGGSAQVPQRQTPVDVAPPSGDSSGNPLEDILGEILKGGANGRVITKQIPPDQMGDILKEIFGRQIPGTGSGSDTEWNAPSEEAVKRGRRTIEDATGSGTPSGNVADDLLRGVEKAIRQGG